MKPSDNKGIFNSPHAHIANSFNVYQQRPPLPLLILMLACAISLALIAFLTPQSPFIYWAVIGVMVLLAVFIKPLAEKLESTRNQIRSLQS